MSSAVELGPFSVGSCILAGRELMGTLARLGSQEGSALGKVLLRCIFQHPHCCGHGAVASLVVYAGENPTLLSISHPQGWHCGAFTELTDLKEENKYFCIKKKGILKFFSLEYLRWKGASGGHQVQPLLRAGPTFKVAPT